MKRNQLPLYVIFALVALAIVYNVANPRPPQLPGPIGEFPGWKSIAARGIMVCQATNPAGTAWAGAWTDDEKELASAIRIIHFDSSPAATYALDKDTAAQYLSWADDTTLRAVTVRPSGAAELVFIDGKKGEEKRKVPLGVKVQRVISWPSESENLAVVSEHEGNSLKAAVVSESGKAVGKEVAFELPNGSSLSDGGGISLDGALFVFTLSDPAAKDGRAFYLADTSTGLAKKAFELGDVPGRIEGIWPSTAGVLVACKVQGDKKSKDEIQSLVYTPATGKLTVQQAGIDLAKWPGAPETIGFTTYDGGREYSLATGKTKIIYDVSKKNSAEDKDWRDFLRDSRLYKLTGGGFIAVSETSGAVDIRKLKSDGAESGALLSRI